MDGQFNKHIAKLVPTRQWLEIAGDWLYFLANINPAGARPTTSLEDFTYFQAVAHSMSPLAPSIRRDVPGLRQIAFHEAVFLLHKASHVIGCAETDAMLGAHTWALSQAYQGAFFAAKSILNLLGVLLPDYDNKTLIVDIWPASLRNPGAGLLKDTTIMFYKLNKRVGHIQMWQLFQYVLNNTTINIWPKEYVSCIVALAPHEFAAQRNHIHYGGGTWIFNDLFDFTPNTTYGLIKDRLAKGFRYDEHSDFTCVLALAIFRMAFLLFESITLSTNKLDPELSLIRSRFDPKYHSLYLSQFP